MRGIQPVLAPDSIVTQGTTCVFGCCTFEWFEKNGRRIVVRPPDAHASCVAELERAFVAQGFSLAFIRPTDGR
jgi:hypothetical protein